MATYHITTTTEFLEIFNSSSAIGTTSEYAEIYLDNDIDFTESDLSDGNFVTWRDCDAYTDYYYFDGQGHTIKGLSITSTTPIRIFHTHEKGYIKNVILDQCYFNYTVSGSSNTINYIFKYTGSNSSELYNTIFDNIIIKGNCKFLKNSWNTQNYGELRIFYANGGRSYIINRIGISGNYYWDAFRGIYIQTTSGVAQVKNIYLNADIECRTGYLSYTTNSTTPIINTWNRSKIKTTSTFYGITSTGALIYCYSNITDNGSTSEQIHPLGNTSYANYNYEALYVPIENYTMPSTLVGTAVTVADLQDSSFLRNRGWWI